MTKELLAKMKETGCVAIQFSISTPYPGTHIYNKPDKFYLKIIDDDFDNYTTQIPVYDSKYLTREEIRSAFFDAFVILGKGEMSENTSITVTN